jgi:hypothetical protein
MGGAGTLAFDNEAAHAIVAGLAAGPRRLRDLAGAGAATPDVLANALVLACAGAVRPVAPVDAPVAALNRVLCGRLGGADEVKHLALSCGTAVRVEPATIRALRDGQRPADPATARWLGFLAVHS